MKFITLLFLCLLSINLYGKSFINKEFQPYVDNFILLSNGKVALEDTENLSVIFKKFPKEVDTLGTCHIVFWDKKIEVSIKWWIRNKDPLERESLLFHELGHCLLLRDHVTPYEHPIIRQIEDIFFNLGILRLRRGLLEDGCPSSYMNPAIVYHYCINHHRDYYLKELFIKERKND